MHCEIDRQARGYAAAQERAVVRGEARRRSGRRGGATSRSGTITCTRQLAPNVFYSGSLEYTSPNAWGELEPRRAVKLPGKGMIEYDLATGKRKFHFLPATRPLVDLPVDLRARHVVGRSRRRDPGRRRAR